MDMEELKAGFERANREMTRVIQAGVDYAGFWEAWRQNVGPLQDVELSEEGKREFDRQIIWLNQMADVGGFYRHSGEQSREEREGNDADVPVR